MDDPAKVIVAVVFFTSVAYSIKAIAQAAVAHRREEVRSERESTPALSEARLARIEQAVGALKRFERIALREAARNYGAFVALARASILIKSVRRASESPRVWSNHPDFCCG